MLAVVLASTSGPPDSATNADAGRLAESGLDAGFAARPDQPEQSDAGGHTTRYVGHAFRRNPSYKRGCGFSEWCPDCLPVRPFTPRWNRGFSRGWLRHNASG